MPPAAIASMLCELDPEKATREESEDENARDDESEGNTLSNEGKTIADMEIEVEENDCGPPGLDESSDEESETDEHELGNVKEESESED